MAIQQFYVWQALDAVIVNIICDNKSNYLMPTWIT